ARRPVPPSPPASPVAPLKGRPALPHAPEREVIIDTEVVRAIFTTRGGTLKSWQLKRYSSQDGEAVDLVAPATGPLGPLLAWSGRLEGAAGLDFEEDKVQLGLRSPSETGSVSFSSRAAGPLRLTKRLFFKGDSYRVEVHLTWENVSRKPIAILPELGWGPGFHASLNKADSRNQPPTSWVDGGRVTDEPEKSQGVVTHGGRVSWTALHDLYFTAALLPETAGAAVKVYREAGGQALVSLAAPAQTLQPGGKATQRFVLYAGPKELDRLKAAGPDLDRIVDLGWFDFLARPALYLLRFLYRYSGNYGIAIILVTLLQKVAFHPLTAKSLRSMQAMQAIQPKIAAVQERFKNNPQKKQQEMMELYKKHGVNPMGGCLPMLVQIPIFIALYNALSTSVEMWRANFLWIRDLSQPDALFTIDIWGLKNYPFNLLALFMGATMFVQQKMAPVAGDPRQAKMMLYLMPTMFTFMFWTFPSGLVLYWLVNNILQIGQQYWLERRGKLAPREAAKAS
ncbi:MAG: membrane protein insertase YidC, partial [Acidobacteria bacterium]|nr:membrane protein insertase YidC [Acidobacteriota bacterium]